MERLQQRLPQTGLPGEFYTDPALFSAELEAIHYREWLFIAHTAELPGTGSFVTAQIGAYPILLVRDSAGVIRGFHNSCRHRGSRVCTAAKGSTPRLVCPYHQWTYALDGRLFSARQMSAEIDRGRLGLKPVHTEVVAGAIFVSLADQPGDFAPYREMIGAYFAPHHLENTKVAHETCIVERGNWKLVWENNRECYHCSPNHPELCRTFLDAPAVTGVEGAAVDPVLASHWHSCEALNLPSTLRLSANGQCRTTRVPLVGDTVSYTLTGRAAVSVPLSPTIAAANFGALLCFHYPSSWHHVLGDHAVSFRVLPLGPGETQLTTKWLVNKDAVEGRDYDIGELTQVWNATNAQDQRIVEENQLGVASPAYEPGPYSVEHEGGVRQFLDWYSSTLSSDLARRAAEVTARVA
jgi:Rieske 2Fe-2S family protein